MKAKEIFKDVIIYIFLILIISSVILPKQISNLDELWNFNFARNIANDKIPYKDFNMVTTPLLPILAGMILKIVGTELLAMRILAVLLCAMILFMLYKILKHLEIYNGIIYLFLIGIFFLYKDHFCIDYNFGVLLIILLTIYIEIKNINKFNPKNEILLGILVGSSILIKQTTGIFFTLIFIFYKILIIYDKTNWKQERKRILYRTVGVLIPIILFFIYLTINNIWYEFIDYTVLGIKTFSNKISYMNLINGNYGKPIKILSITIPIFLIFLYIKTICMKVKTKESKILFILFAYSIATLIVIFPISDDIHFLIGIMPVLLTFIYALWAEIILRIPNNKIKIFFKYFIQCLSIIFSLFIVAKFSYKTYCYTKEMKQYNDLKNFKYIECYPENIKRIDEFITSEEKTGKKVYILDASAVIYMIHLDKCNKDYDLFLKGNLGKDGEEGQIKKLQEENNIIVLILKDNYSRNWQNPEKVRQYIINNWGKIEEINCFDIYERK